VNDSRVLRQWVRAGGYRTESEAVRAAVAAALAIRRMQDTPGHGSLGRRAAKARGAENAGRRACGPRMVP